MTLSIWHDEELVEALGYSSGATWGAYELRVSDQLRSNYGGPEQKRAWRAIPENWQRELEGARRKYGRVSLDEHRARVRAERLAREADEEVQAARKARQAALQRERARDPVVRARRREEVRARRAAMTVEDRRAEWARHQRAKRERDRARQGTS